MSTETSERARMDAAQQQKQQAQNAFDRLNVKSPYWSERVASAERALDEPRQGKAAHDAKLADAQTVLDAATDLYTKEAERFAAMKAEFEKVLARLGA
jgi:chromosome segregation ATPase